jgi:OOP family OmpA-OmpF porin
MNTKQLMGLAAAATLLAGCAAPRHQADARGVAFPVADSSYLKNGAFIEPAQIALVRNGLSKDQARLQLGNPHFSEGLAGVSDWNYAFNFYTGNGSDYVTCQYQVQFGDDKKVSATYWQTPECADLAAPKAAVVAAAPVAASSEIKAVILPGDVLFAFGRSGLKDVDESGQNALARFADSLKQATVHSITVAGHADRIGTSDSNYALSMARAQTVADFLVGQGLDPNLIQVVGKGRFETVTECQGAAATPAVVDCLQPDRRVSVSARTSAK